MEQCIALAMLPADAKSYDDLINRFRWDVPETFNIGVACADAPAGRNPDGPAIIDWSAEEPVTLTFGELADRSSRLAGALRARGIARGDRVAILLPQCFEAVIAHIAVYKLGAIAVPMAMQFGPDAIAYRLTLSGARAILLDQSGLEKLKTAGAGFEALQLVISVGGGDGTEAFDALVAAAPSGFTPVDTQAGDPALMIFTSGTTGQPKGALHAHRVLLGHLPGVQMHHEFLPQPGDLLWTPADWAWAGGLLNVLLPGLFFGVPVVAARAPRFEAEWALALMERAGIRNTFLPPTALRMLSTVEDVAGRYGLKLRTIGSGGEALGKKTLEWCRETLGLTVNEFYGQTECNLVLSACRQIDVLRPGSMGKPVPGHHVAIINDDGSVLPPGAQGQIAVRRPDPVMFLRYWSDNAATEKKFIGDWMTTGDRGVMDADGFFHFVGRDDDVITSAGYRIGPAEIEDCLVGHPAVALAAVIGKPDPMRTQLVKAYIVLRKAYAPGDNLKREIQSYVKARLSAHEYPREIEFIDEMPLTTTGKVIRRLFRERAVAESG
ncbi:AMP-binding protein [Oricola cellulosilytica]|uniref:AMP-dependent synthetase n=1 Tax=Oricola cellulosilytica TaxID=1429082 RepID=A0A4R0PBH0_9HYPH|nr:AMP-binding protein [Oricola cellulosilytica]TCD13697.1 AMP-dependent synthetase [Oricola cellulosilytica]